MPSRRLGHQDLAGRVSLAFVLVLAFGAGRALAAGNGWTITLSPATIPAATSSTVKATITNLGGPDGSRELGCVRITIPLTFSIKSATVISRPANTKWTASIGIGSVTISSPSGGDRLPPDGTTSVSAAIAVLALTPGTYAWTANAYRQGDCTDGYSQPIGLKVVVELVAGSTPVPTVDPTVRPSSPPTPTPTPRSTPAPTAVPAATPVPTTAPGPSPVPGQSPTPRPPATPLPASTPESDGGGGSGATPAGSAASTPPTGSASPSAEARPSPSPALGAALILPGTGPDDGSTGAGAPSISLTSGFETPFGDGFEWAVPGLVLSVPGLLIVLIAIGAQAFGAAAWLPVVRRRIGGFELDRRREGASRGAGTGA